MRYVLGVRAFLAFGLVAMVPPVAARGEDPAVPEKEKMKRWDQQFRDSLDWYRVFAGPNSREPMKPVPVLRWLNPTRGQKGEPTLIFWTSAGRPEALASVYPWNGNLVYECVSLARDAGLTAKEGGRTIWSPGAAGVAFRDLADAPIPSKNPAARLGQLKGISERFKVALVDTRAGAEVREEMRLLPKPIYRYDLEAAKAAHPDLIDGAAFAFAQGTDPEAVLLVEAVRRGDRAAWQYAFSRSTGYPLEAKLGPSAVWSVTGMPTWNDPKLTGVVFGRPLVE